MESILLTELDKRIRASSDSVSWARDMCRAASHYARQGQPEVALKWLDSVKRHFGKRIDPEVACWLMLAEGLVHYYKLEWTVAYDLFRGAYGAALAFQVEVARPTCAAWMAFAEFNDGRFDPMIRFLEEALLAAPKDDHQARARACLVLADSYHFAGNFAAARPWYDRARGHGSAEGDGSTISSLMHNMAAFRTNNVRLADAFNSSSLEEAKQASMEAASAYSYARAVGLSVWSRDNAPLLQAQAIAVQGRYDDALRLLSVVDSSRLPSRDRAILAVERAWCLVQLDHFDHAAEFATEAAQVEELTQDPDDLAYVYARLASIEERTGRQYLERCSERASEALERHRDGQRALLTKLEALASRLSNTNNESE